MNKIILIILTLLAFNANAGSKSNGLANKIAIEHGSSFVDNSDLLDSKRISDHTLDGFSGAAWMDYDNDQDLDVFIVNGVGVAGTLFRNDGGEFVNVTEQAGIVSLGGNAAALAGDINNDGCVDLYLAGAGGFFGPPSIVTNSKLFKNNCDGTFSDITEASGLSNTIGTSMAAFGDINNDGFLDMYTANHGSLGLGILEPQHLYLNNGNSENPAFTEIGEAAGVDSKLGGCVVNFFDYNEDGWQDILVGNCNDLAFPEGGGFRPIPGPWNLFVNNGDLTFTDMADSAGLNARPAFPMSLNIDDIDNDGDMDIFSTGIGVALASSFGGIFAEQVLFVNNGDGTFSNGTDEHGLGGFEWGWGAAFGDFDNDGDNDLFTAGSLIPFGIAGPGLAGPGRYFDNTLEESGQANFEMSQTFGQEFIYVTGLASADYNSDGFEDVLIVTTEVAPSTDGSPILLTNEGNGNNSVTLRLKGVASNAQGIGARLHLTTRSGSGSPSQDQFSHVQAGTGFASTHSPWPIFGIGKAKKARVTVTWPSGLVETFKAKANQITTLVEGTGKKPH